MHTAMSLAYPLPTPDPEAPAIPSDPLFPNPAMESKMNQPFAMFPRRAALSFALVLCTAFASSSSLAAGPATGVRAVDITGFKFVPQEITVAPGTTVRWVNRDQTQHTVTSDTKLFDSKALSPGEKFEFTFTTAGDFSYHCSIHSFMTGIVHVVK